MSSSKSPQASENLKPSKATDLIVIGDGAPDWSGPLFCHYANLSGLKVTYVSCENHHERPVSVLHVGNGELKESARLIFGDKLSSSLWDISQSNLQQFLSLTKSPQASMLWFGKGEREFALAKASAKTSKNFLNSGALLKQGKETFSSVLEEGACLIDNDSFLNRYFLPEVFPAEEWFPLKRKVPWTARYCWRQIQEARS